MPHQCTGCGRTFSDGSKEMLSGCPDCGGNKFQFRPAGAVSDPDSDSDSDSGDASSAELNPPEPADEPPQRPDADRSSVAETVGKATTKMRDLVSSDPSEAEANAEWPDGWEGGASASNPSASSGKADSIPADSDTHDEDIIDADSRRVAAEDADPKENAAQASARSDVVSSEDLAEREPTAMATDEDDLTEENPPSERADGQPDTDGEIVSEPTEDDPDLAELRDQLNDQFESIKILEPGQYELYLMELYDREEYIIALQENGRYVIQVPEQWIGDDIEDR